MSTEGNNTGGPDLAVTIHAPIGALPGDRWTGSTLGKYHIVRQLGQGGMGVVYEANDPVLQRSVAIKVLRDGIAGQPEAVRKFLREARTAALLNHPHIIAIYEANQEKGMCYLVMELMDGGSAEDRLRKWGAFGWVEATEVIADACRGLAAVHAIGLIHRDVKPSNIMRGNEGAVKLADFGLALMTNNPSSRGSPNGGIVGTPLYMSPEQCRGEKIDRRSDIYALGATYYTLLTGQPPFVGDAPMDIMQGHCLQPIPNPCDINAAIPSVCSAIISTAMSKQPEQRPATVEDFLRQLQDVLSLTGKPAYQPLDWVSKDEKSYSITTNARDSLNPISTRRSTRWWVVGVCLLLMGIAYGAGRKFTKSPTDSPDTAPPMGVGSSTQEQDVIVPPALVKTTEFDAGGPVTSLAFDPRDGDTLSWATRQGNTKVQQIFFRKDKYSDLITRDQMLATIEQVAYAPAANLWGYLYNGGLHFFETDGFKRIRDDSRYDLVQKGPILFFAFHPKENIIAMAFRDAANSGGVVVRWLKDTPQDIERRTSDGQPPTCLGFSTDGSLLLQGKESGIVQIWKVDLVQKHGTGEDECAVNGAGSVKIGHGRINRIAAMDTSRFAVAVGKQIILFDGRKGEKLFDLQPGEEEVTSLAASPATNRLACACGKTIVLYDLTNNRKIHTWHERTRPVHAIAFDQKGEKIAAGDDSGAITIYPVGGL